MDPGLGWLLRVYCKPGRVQNVAFVDDYWLVKHVARTRRDAGRRDSGIFSIIEHTRFSSLQSLTQRSFRSITG